MRYVNDFLKKERILLSFFLSIQKYYAGIINDTTPDSVGALIRISMDKFGDSSSGVPIDKTY